jgi:RNA polymerase sigma-70 factor (ECF subfamily)
MGPDRSAEADLVARMAAGDTGAALEAFYRRFAGVVLAVANRILSSRAEAEEVLQEIFTELWRRAPQYERERASVTTWVLTVARSRALDALRARSRRPGGAGEESAIAPAPDEERPDERALAQQRSAAVRSAIGRLTPDQRQAVELAYFDGLSHSEIAARLNLPLGTVKSRILSAMKLLRGGLAELGEDP